MVDSQVNIDKRATGATDAVLHLLAMIEQTKTKPFLIVLIWVGRRVEIRKQKYICQQYSTKSQNKGRFTWTSLAFSAWDKLKHNMMINIKMYVARTQGV